MTSKKIKLIDTQNLVENAMKNNIRVLEEALADEKKRYEEYIKSRKPKPKEIIPPIVVPVTQEIKQ